MSSPTGRKRRFKVADVEAALRSSFAIYSAAAAILEPKYGTCSPNTIRNYVRRYARLQAVEDEIRGQTLDLAETKLIGAIRDGNMTAIIFYLKTKGADRGYIEHHKHSGTIRTPDAAGPRTVNATFNFVEPVEKPPSSEDDDDA